MELRILEYFLAVAREQSITAAAESLHISQPALSTQLKSMEEELGKPLLIRGTKGSRKVVLTDEGMILRKRAEEILSLVRKTEDEIIRSDETIMGDVYIGSGETDAVRLLARAAKNLQKKYPHIHYHISSGNAEHVLEYMDKGLIDFGLLYQDIDSHRFEAIPIPAGDTWGILMRKDSPWAKKETICPEDLWDKPLIVSQQKNNNSFLEEWLKKKLDELNVIATYNLVFNASLLVDEGLGYALCFDKLINTQASNLCFRPLSPNVSSNGFIVWKKYQIFSKAARVFLEEVQSQFTDYAANYL